MINCKSLIKKEWFLAFLINYNLIMGFIELLGEKNAFFKIISSHALFVSGMIMVYCLLIFLRDFRVNADILIIIFGWMVGVIITYLESPQIVGILPRAIIYFILKIIVTAYICSKINDINGLNKYFNTYLFIMLLYIGAFWKFWDGSKEYSMDFTYQIVVPGLFSLYKSFNSRGISKVLYSCLTSIVIVANLKFGSRGLYFIFFIMMLYMYINSSIKFKIGTVLSTSCIVVILVSQWNRLSILLLRMFPHARNVRLITTGQFLYPAKRNIYYSELIKRFISDPIRIRGLYSDRLLMSSLKMDYSNMWGYYAHNIFVELIYQLGIVGVFLSLFLIYKSVYSTTYVLRKGDDDLKCFWGIVISYALGQLLLSSSYLIAPSFGLLIGSIIYVDRRRKDIEKRSLCFYRK